MKKRQRLRKPYRVKKKESVIGNRFFWLAFLVLIILGGIFYLIYFSFTFQIKEVQISGNEKISKEILLAFVKEQTDNKILFFSSRSIFLVNSDKTKESFLKEFPEIVQINLKKDFPDIVRVEIEERRPVAVFCQLENCFFIDKTGIIYEKFIGENYQILKIRNLIISKEVKIGERAVEEEKLIQILDIESKLKIHEIQLQETGLVTEERLNVKTAEGWEIYFNPREDINWQLTELELILKEKLLLEKRGSLEYIDLRFSRVYYK